MASLFLRSAAGRLVRRSMPPASFPRSPVRFFSHGGARMESKHSSSKYGISPAEVESESSREWRKIHEEAQRMIEHGERLEKQQKLQKQRQTVLSFIIFPTLAAVCIFGPDKKKNSQEPIELTEAQGKI